MSSYYDWVLLAIPTILLGGSTIPTFVGIDVMMSATGAGALSGLLVLHALFVRGPVNLQPEPTLDEDTEVVVE